MDDRLRWAKKTSELKLQKIVGYGALSLMALQVLIADLVFYKYADANAWDISTAAISAWLAATVIEVVSVVMVITKSLFPSRDAND